MDNLRLNYKIWLETDGHVGVLGDKKCELLRAIDETGSLNDAMKKLGLTYRKTWDNLKRIEKELGFPAYNPYQRRRRRRKYCPDPGRQNYYRRIR